MTGQNWFSRDHRNRNAPYCTEIGETRSRRGAKIVIMARFRDETRTISAGTIYVQETAMHMGWEQQ